MDPGVRENKPYEIRVTVRRETRILFGSRKGGIPETEWTKYESRVVGERLSGRNWWVTLDQ